MKGRGRSKTTGGCLPNFQEPEENKKDDALGNKNQKNKDDCYMQLMQNDEDSPKCTWKDGLRIGIFGFLAFVFAVAIGVMWFVPGAQLIAAPLTYAGISTLIAAEIGTTAVLGAGALLFIAAARESITVLLSPILFIVKVIGEILRGALEICLSIISPFLPNKWLAKAYERLHKPICQEEGKIVVVSQECENKSFGQKALAIPRNIGVGLVTAVANTGILLGRLAIKIAKLADAVFIKAVVTNKFARRVDNAFAEAEDSMDNATCEVNSLSMDKNSVTGSIYYRLSAAQSKADEFNAGQPSPANNRSTLLKE